MVDEEHDFGRGEGTGTTGFNLGRVEELEAFVRAHGGRVNLEAFLEITVEFAGSHAAGRVLADFFNGTKEAGDIFARAGREGDGRGVGQEEEFAPEFGEVFFEKFAAFAIASEQVPFVKNEEDGFFVFLNELGDAFFLTGYSLGGVKD